MSYDVQVSDVMAKGRPMISESDFKLSGSLERIKHVIIVISGKGGVGKSTVSSNLALSLAMRNLRTGLMDVDIHGPNIPKMFGLEDADMLVENDKLVPVMAAHNLKVMSMAFLLPERDAPVAWRGPVKMGAIRQFIEDVAWGDLDCLVIDMPPGTGDEALSIIQLIPKADGMIIVTTPQDVALLDSRKSIVFSATAEIPIIGVVENMSGFICPHCNERSDIFKSGGGERTATEMGIQFLGRIPIEPGIVESGDSGVPIVASAPDSLSARAFSEITDKVIRTVMK
ncbi:MAG: Mrp/NBP35 family ATP-binding protein [Methanomassiliicoccaceae archaeon]|jgi:Mrp family chromosome partitioning ATPase|nr:Mrp/NBP35 family ATP-binding protein [Methanomassiliicoccaceae archaeon]